MEHDFDFVNEGPSYTNEDKLIQVFLPKADFIANTTVKVDENNCTLDEDNVDALQFLLKEKIPKSDEGLENMFCAGKNCTVYNCKVAKPWLKGDINFKKVSIQMKMYGADIPATSYLVYSFVNIVGETGKPAFACIHN